MRRFVDLYIRKFINCTFVFVKGGPKRDNDGISNVGAPVYIAVARQYVLVARGKKVLATEATEDKCISRPKSVSSSFVFISSLYISPILDIYGRVSMRTDAFLARARK